MRRRLSVKIGVSSQNFRTITGHAGKARRFIIYATDVQGGVQEVDRLDLPKSMSMHETAHGEPHPLDELDVLITSGSGAGFVRKMNARQVEVIHTDETDPFEAVTNFANGSLLPLKESVQNPYSERGNIRNKTDHLP